MDRVDRVCKPRLLQRRNGSSCRGLGRSHRSASCDNGTCGRRAQAGGRHIVRAIDFSPDGRRLVAGVDNETIQIWDVSTARYLRGHEELRGPIYSVDFSSDGRRVAYSLGNSVKVWGIEDYRESRTLEGHTGTVFTVSFSPDAKWLASGAWDGTVRLWDVVAGKELLIFGGQSLLLEFLE